MQSYVIIAIVYLWGFPPSGSKIYIERVSDTEVYYEGFLTQKQIFPSLSFSLYCAALLETFIWHASFHCNSILTQLTKVDGVQRAQVGPGYNASCGRTAAATVPAALPLSPLLQHQPPHRGSSSSNNSPARGLQHQLVHAACVEVPRQQGQGHPWHGGVDLGVGDSNSSIHLGAWEHDIPAEECTEDSFRSFSKEKRPINLKSYRKWEKHFNELVHLASLVDGWMETTREAPYYYAMTSLDSLQSSLNSSVQDLPTCLQTSSMQYRNSLPQNISLEQEEVKPADCTNFPVFSSPRKFGIGLKENGHIDCTSYLTPKSSHLFDSDFSSLLFHCVLPPTSQTGTIYLQ